ncbi:uncharacterized protein LOC105835739 [Monomorium pharaonis]|uniref:uncharacterized protein LOC105835739 n=1 Tax=Monomorium pharaonis TaxID=307658 RepID=UPI00063F94AD|nr:uncharacterized protein LOC105835739 [Monomorium pharaonis]
MRGIKKTIRDARKHRCHRAYGGQRTASVGRSMNKNRFDNMLFRYVEIDERTKLETTSEIERKKRPYGPSVGLRRSHEALGEPIKFVPAVESAIPNGWAALKVRKVLD